jgi:hypothetical protein
MMYAHKSAVAQFLNVYRSHSFEFVQLSPLIRNRMFSNRQPRPAKIRVHSLHQSHLL